MNINDIALRYLSNRMRTEKEVRVHLASKGFEGEEIDNLVEDFKVYGYIDDEKYTHAYFRYAFGKGKGKSRVFYELREKGVSQNIIDIAFEDTEEIDSERDRALKEAMKILNSEGICDGDAVPEKIVNRIGRRLQSKGYSTDVIYSIIGEIRR